ncbi:unnamed protein product [Blepharisma stoltei]|uniref:Uncharacterized protein n=1 Tax=Blepharisma stoltei TaxID=1481888 RepID=A0AAU9K5D3_9CILI|nr:unnamed protein product [Blepharisma stoltei]
MDNSKFLKLYENLVAIGYPLSSDSCSSIDEIEREMTIFLIPGEARLHIQEWLIEKYEPGILSDSDLNLLSENQYHRLHYAYLQIGLGAQSLEVIQGQCGHDSSISLLINLVELVKFSSADPVSTLKNSELCLNYITENLQDIFSQELKIFPPTFPQKYSSSSKNALIDLDQTIQYWENHLESLKSQTSLLNVEVFYEEPTKQQVKDLKEEIEKFSKEIKDYRSLYEQEIQQELAHKYYGLDQQAVSAIQSAPHFSPLLGIGKKSSDCKKSHEKVMKLLEDIENIWGMLNVIKTSSQ